MALGSALTLAASCKQTGEYGVQSELSRIEKSSHSFFWGHCKKNIVPSYNEWKLPFIFFLFFHFYHSISSENHEFLELENKKCSILEL